MSQAPKDTRTTVERWDDRDLILGAMRRAVGRALLDHKRSGDPIVTIRDGRVVWIAAEDIQIPDDLD